MNQALAKTQTQQPARRSVLHDMAQRYGMEPDAFELTVRATCSPAPRKNEREARPLSREEFAAFLLVAREYRLNPITREIFAYPKRGGGVVPVVSIDGWVNLVNSHPACDGFTFEYEHAEDGQLIACTCILYRKDRNHPTEVKEYLSECWRDTEPWKMKHRMLRHKALIQCARYAFGFAGIYDEEEGQKIAENRISTLPGPDQAPRPPRPGQPSSGDETRADGPEKEEGTVIECEIVGGEPEPEEGKEAQGADEGDDDQNDADYSFFDELRERLAEASDAETVEEIWTEFDPLARFEDAPLDQEICLNIKGRRLRQLGINEG